MEVNVVQNQIVDFQPLSGNDPSKNFVWCVVPQKITQKIGSICSPNQNYFYSELQQSLAQVPSPTNFQLDEFQLSLAVAVSLGLDGFSTKLEVSVADAYHYDGVFSRLTQICGRSDMFSLDLDMCFGTEDKMISFTVKGVNVLVGELQKLHEVTMTDALHSAILKWAHAYKPFKALMSISLNLSDEALNSLHQNSQPDDTLGFFRRLMIDEVLTDAVLVGSNGVGVNCHKNILAVYSPVFKAMFEGSMTEASGTVKIREMSECAIRAFLAYLYGRDITQISKCSSVALQLIVAANIYDIPMLRETVHCIILAKEDTWFHTGDVIQLFQFAIEKQSEEGNPGWDQIEKMAAAVIRRKSPEEIKACEEYQELLQNPIAGTKFCLYFTHVKQ